MNWDKDIIKTSAGRDEYEKNTKTVETEPVKHIDVIEEGQDGIPPLELLDVCYICKQFEYKNMMKPYCNKYKRDVEINNWCSGFEKEEGK
jgi:hypothetical protein